MIINVKQLVEDRLREYDGINLQMFSRYHELNKSQHEELINIIKDKIKLGKLCQIRFDDDYQSKGPGDVPSHKIGDIIPYYFEKPINNNAG